MLSMDRESCSQSRGESLIGAGLIDTLKRWSSERPWVMMNQRRVRTHIANAMTTDILHPVGSPNVPVKVEKYRGRVDGTVRHIIHHLGEMPISEDGVVIQSQLIRDKVTGTEFIARIRHLGGSCGGSWVSEEVDAKGNRIISQAVLYDNGESELTLDYSHQRYEKTEANLHLLKRREFPTGSRVLFANHAALLGIIDWSRKTKRAVVRTMEK